VKRYIYATVYGIVKYLPTPVGDLLRFVVLRCFMKRLRTVWIHEGVTMHWPEKISVGERTSLNEFVFINGFGGVTIGGFVAIGSGVKIFSAEHSFSGREVAPYCQPITERPVVIEDEAYLGLNAVILGGVRVGRGSVVGAGAVVTKDVPPYAVVAGVPARVIRYR